MKISDWSKNGKGGRKEGNLIIYFIFFKTKKSRSWARTN